MLDVLLEIEGIETIQFTPGPSKAISQMRAWPHKYAPMLYVT